MNNAIMLAFEGGIFVLLLAATIGALIVPPGWFKLFALFPAWGIIVIGMIIIDIWTSHP